MIGPEDNPRDDEPIDREEYEKWERERDPAAIMILGPDYTDEEWAAWKREEESAIELHGARKEPE
jgi:hypothetical protein